MENEDRTCPKRFAFIVQGEGRGHLTQAIALKEVLEKRGHTVCAVLVGKSPIRDIPEFFKRRIRCEIVQFDSPNFIRDSNQKGVRISRTILYNFKNIGAFRKSLRQIDNTFHETQPDVIINFYDLLFGFYTLFYKLRIPVFCLGNQYLNTHPEYVYPKHSTWNRFLFKLNTWMTGLRCRHYLALSFNRFADSIDPHLTVVPPILRSEIFKLAPCRGEHFLIYLLNEGYFSEIIQWHKQNPQYKIHAFWDKKGVEDPYHYSENLTFHQISDTLFLELMESCRGLATSAGFESVSEAAFLGKPVLMVPTKGHFEQHCNALNAQKIGVGVYSPDFNLTRLIEYEKKFQPNAGFQEWIQQAEERILFHLDRLMKVQEPTNILSRIASRRPFRNKQIRRTAKRKDNFYEPSPK